MVKPNLSELVTMVQACLDQNLITDGRATLAHTLKNIQKHSPLVWVDNVTWTDIRILAVALQGVMSGSGLINHTVKPTDKATCRNAEKSTLATSMTNEGLPRKVKGKHVIVSIGHRGLLWCADKSSILLNDTPPTTSSLQAPDPLGAAVEAYTTILNDNTAIKIFPVHTLSHAIKGQPITNGAGDACLSGIISALLDVQTVRLDTGCIEEGLRCAAEKIAANADND